MSDFEPYSAMRLTYVARSFLDYRVPVFAHLNELLEGRLSVVYSKKWTPERVQERLADAIGHRAIGLTGEKRLGDDGRAGFANASFCVPYQPGLFRAIRNTNPDILAADGFFRWTPAAIAYRIRHSTPLVMCYERTMHTERNAQRVRTIYRKMAARWFDAVCCSGKLSVEYMRWIGYPPQRINIGHQAADTADLQNRVDEVPASHIESLQSELNAGGTIYLCVARLIPLKGIRELLVAWNRFRSQQANKATLLFVGGGPERDALETVAADSGLDDVRFAGEIDYREIAPYFALANVLVMPTLEDNWSLVVPEAMACGLPILCSRYNGCWPELVIENQNGWVFDPLDPHNTSAALASVAHAANDGTLASMGQRSREIVAEHTPEHAARAILDACAIAARHRGKIFAEGETAAVR
ncbi:MAG: glycosyltransferase [Planctomycetales bacterium]|nr:glycosyltransferase [Planctomycetales bacterium]